MSNGVKLLLEQKMDPLAQLRALSGAARRSPLTPQTQIDLMNQGMPKSPAYFLTERMLGQNMLPAQVEPSGERSGPVGGYGVRQAMTAPVGADYSGNRQVVPQNRGPIAPGMTYQRPDYNPGVPGTASVPATRRASPVMQAAGGTYTPEGDLATAVSKMDMTPDPAYVAQAREAAQQLGQQRYAATSEGQAMIGRTQQAQERYNPAGRPDYNAMSPVQAAMVSQNTYRSGGRAGAMGGMSTMDGSLRDREDAIALAQQSAGPPRPSNGAQVRESRGMMQQAVSGELERMGGQYNPNISFENNARGMSPGATFTGQTSTGVPMIVSRGSAAPLTEGQQEGRDDRNRDVRQARAGKMAELGQNRMAQLQQERDYAMDPVNRLATAAMGDPRAAAMLGGGIANSRVGMGQNQVAADGLQRQIGLDDAAEDRASQELQAKLGVSKAEADLAIGKLKALEGADNPQARAQATMLEPGYRDLPLATQRRIEAAAWPDEQGAVTGDATPMSVTEAVSSRTTTAPAVEGLMGAGSSGWKPDAISANIMERMDEGAPFADQDLQAVQQDYQARAASEKDFKPREKTVTNALTASGEEKVVFEQMMDARLRQAMPITAGEVQAIREQARVAAEVARQSTQKTVESPAVYSPSGISDTGRYLGMP